MKKYTNKQNIPLSVALWLGFDSYDLDNTPKTISATALIKPIRSIILQQQYPDAGKATDIMDLVPSRMGTAIHDAIESAWKSDKVPAILESLGYPKAIAEKTRVNPDTVDEDLHNFFVEQRVKKEIAGWVVSGKYDVIANGVMEDHKSTSVWGYILGGHDTDYIRQGSINRWLNPDKVTSDVMAINYIFTDYSKAEASRKKDYPPHKVLQKKLPLMSFDETEKWIGSRLNEVDDYLQAEQSEMPECTYEELWQKPTLYKYYSNPAKLTRSTKNFDDSHEANQRLMEDGNKGIIITVPGQVKRCEYCNVVEVCDQAKALIQKGLVIL